MLNTIHVRALASRPERTENSVLTVYLDVDQSQQANVNRGFETHLKDMIASVRNTIHAGKDNTASYPQKNDAEIKAFDIASQRVKEFAAQYRVRARGIAIVFDTTDGYFWGGPVDFPTRSEIRWGREVYVGPLAVALDEYERVGIVLLDRANLRMFTMFLGEVEEHIHEAFNHREVRHTRTVGMDHMGSSSRAQRKADERARLNLRYVGKAMHQLLEQRDVSRLILAGSPEITSELRAILPKRLSSQVIGVIDIATNATIEQIQSAAKPVAEKFERDTEDAVVRDLVTSAAKSRRVVIGLADTLQALNERRVWRLIYAEFHAPGYECPSCAALFSVETSSCSFCGSPVNRIDDVVESVVDHAVRNGANVEVIRSERAGPSLMKAGGIGAFLRTRSASVLVS